jgi:hypothetical protein
MRHYYLGLSDTQRAKFRANRADYIGRDCTLNGEPARTTFCVTDGHCYVNPINASIGGFAWSWCAVYNILDNRNGRFES